MKLKQDKFRKNRGGYSRLLDLSCAKCGTRLFSYQKDGSGILKRLYLDRIINLNTPINGKSKLECQKCKELLGMLMIYKKEQRPAIRLFAGSVTKNINNVTI